MTTEDVKVRIEGGILEVTIDRPKANAIDRATSIRLGEIFSEFRDNPDFRVAIITGGGEKFFCAGWDLKAAAAGEEVDGDYGIRIENIYVVRESAIEGMFEFEALTLAPIDKSLMDTKLLSDSEIDWLNNYHAKVWSALSPRLPESNAAWLKQATSMVLKREN